MSKGKGGIYVIRCDKPGALLGLPFIGRHMAYVGMTNSYFHRERQHFFGSSTYGHAPKPFSDLRPKLYRVVLLPHWMLHGKLIGRPLMQVVETIVIWLTCPVYNNNWQQPPYNLRRIRPRRADAQRIARMKHGMAYKIRRTAARGVIFSIIIGGVGWTAWQLLNRG